ncbi:hypothetical protein LguiA_025472 [Lonicera macranthoides]
MYDMSNLSSGFGDDRIHDLESQLVNDNGGSTTPKDHWRWIFLILQARQVLISRALPSKKGPLPSTLSFALIGTSDPANYDVELTQTVEILPPSPQVSLDVHSDGSNDRELQHATIAKIVKGKDLTSLHEFGNVQGFAETLNSDLVNGIAGDKDDLCWRCSNSSFSTKAAEQQRIFHFLLNGSNKYIIFLLLICAVLSIGFGIKVQGPDTGWYEGAFIIFAISILVAVATVRDFWCSQKLLSRGRQVVVQVVRGGCPQEISISDVVMGDVVCLTAQKWVPADGLFISGENLKLDHDLEPFVNEQNPFLFYGAKVISGTGRMLVTSVGKDTALGEMMSTLVKTPYKKTPLQVQIDKVNCCIQIIGLLITVFILVVLFLRFNLGKKSDASGFPDLKRKPTALREFLDAFKKISMNPRGKVSVVTSLVMLLVGMTEGLPFVASLVIAYWNKKIMLGKGTAQDLLATVTMGSITAICTDISSGVISNKIEVEMFYIGEELLSDDSEIALHVLEPLQHGICTPALKQQNNNSNPRECAIVSWVSQKWGMNEEMVKQQFKIVPAKKSNSSEDGCDVLIRIKRVQEKCMNLHWKGPAKTILAMCSHYYDIRGEKVAFDEHKKISFQHLVEDMQGKNLEIVAYAYKQTEDQILEENGLTLLGLVGLKNSCREEIEAYMKAGVNIILVSGEKVPVVESFALNCSMPMPSSGAVVLGEVFRNSTDDERMNMANQIRVMGESLATDRLLLVKSLREKGHIVAVVGARTDEVPALKEADVGITVGNRSTEMARENSDIILNENFSFLVTIMRNGQCAVENIRKLIQVEATMTTAWCLINLIMTVCFGDSQITAIQLLWVYLILTILCSLPLLTYPATEKLMRGPPTSQFGSLITWTMRRNIVTQALYQTAILVTFRFKGEAIIDINHKVSETMIFNCFVLCQVFNQFNARELERMNVFKGIHQDHWLWLAVGGTALLQEAFIEIAHIVSGSARLTGKQYAICLLIGMVSWAIDLAVKCISQVFEGLLTTRPRNSNAGSTGMTDSASSESLINLESPLINVNP